MARYDLETTFETAVTVWIWPVICAFIFVGLGIGIFVRFPVEDRWFGVVAGAMALFPLLAFLYNWRTPRTIEVFDDGRVVFEGPLIRKEVQARDIEYIRVRQSYSRYLLVVHRRGTINILHHFNGFHDLVAELKGHNANIQTIGC